MARIRSILAHFPSHLSNCCYDALSHFMHRTAAPSPTRQRLTLRDRKRIESYLRSGKTVSDVARLLNRWPSCIRYEINNHLTEGVYIAVEAHAQAKLLRSTARRGGGVIESNPLLEEVVVDKLREFWSPEAVSAFIHNQEDESLPGVSINTIYRYIYRHPDKALYLYLRSRKTRLKKRSGKPRQYDRYPSKQRTGWETDTMMFSGCPWAVSVTVECESLRVVLSLMRTEDVMDKAIAIKKVIALEEPTKIIYDQREENNSSMHFRRYWGVQSVISEGPWDKPVVENTIGFLRPYFRLVDVEGLTEQDLDYIAESYNNRWRKKHGWRSPNQVGLLLNTV